MQEPTPVTSPSWIDLQGAANVRDVAGLATVDGRTTRPRVLIRADNLQTLTPSDVHRLVDEHHVRAVLDLRTSGEVRLEGPGPLVGLVAHHHLSLVPEWPGEPDEVEVDRAIPTWDDATRDGPTRDDPTPDDPTRDDRRGGGPSDMTGHYLGYVQDARDNLAAALRAIADPGSGATLVHCAAGKDRTGTVVALALSLAGVTRQAVVADYAASADRIDGVLARLQASPTYAEELRTATVDDIRPRPDYMERFLDEVDRRYGGAHGLAMSIGLDEETVARLVTRLVGAVRGGARPGG